MKAVIVGAGSGVRFKEDKLSLRLGLFDVLTQAVLPFVAEEAIDEIAVVVDADGQESVRTHFGGFDKIRVVVGGSTRSDSVKRGLIALKDTDYVVVHDAARPFLSSETLSKTIARVSKNGAVTTASPIADSIREITTDGTKPQDRSRYLAVHTPQAFDYKKLLEAMQGSKKQYTDEAALYEAYYGISPEIVDDSCGNRKITYPDDFLFGKLRIGIGRDCHRLESGIPLVLGGVSVPFDKGLLGVSDADVLLHSIMDAMLTAAGLPDIGHYFPPEDPRYKGIDSTLLLEEVKKALDELSYSVINISAVIEAEKPRLAPYLDKMCARIREILGEVDIKLAASTTEGLGIIGEGKGMAATACCLIMRK